jgi:hypothetical protein
MVSPGEVGNALKIDRDLDGHVISPFSARPWWSSFTPLLPHGNAGLTLGGGEEAAATVAERGADVYYPDASRHDLYDAVYRQVFLSLSQAVAVVDRRMAEIGLRARTKGGRAGAEAFSAVATRTW